MKFNILVIDPPYEMNDPLTMSSTKRGAASNYNGTLTLEDIKKLDIEKIAAKDSLLALWVPSAMLPEGLEIMKQYDFTYKQNFIWVKTKKDPLNNLRKDFKKSLLTTYKQLIKEPKEFGVINLTSFHNFVKHELISQMDYDLNSGLQCLMGRLFRQTHEICLIGVRGKISKYRENKWQISVHMHPPLSHSAKPEGLQDKLDIMMPDKNLKKVELFARRQRSNYLCLGNESPMTKNEDIRDSIKKLNQLKVREYKQLLNMASENNYNELADFWENHII